MNRSIFGSLAPKFVYDYGGPNQYSVHLNYWVPLTDEPEEGRDIIQDSELEADRDIIDRGNFWLFEGRVNLYKYSSLSNIRSKFEEINQFNKKKVILWKHSDGHPFKDKDGNAMLWYLKITPKNFYTLDYRDVLILSFRSLKEIDYSDGSEIIVQPSEIIITDSIVV